MARLQVGDILGFSEIDNGLTTQQDAWCLCRGKVEAIWLDKEHVMRLWELQNFPSNIMRMKKICQEVKKKENSSILRNLSSRTINLLMFEGARIVTFKPGQKITSQISRSPYNKDHKEYFEK